MKTLEYCKENWEKVERDHLIDSRWTKRFIDYLPAEEWGKYGFKFKEGCEHHPKEWTEENIIEQLKLDVLFGWEKCCDERGISSSLMADVVRSWCDVLENGLVLDDNESGYYSRNQFLVVAKKYGWELDEMQ